MLIWEWIKGAFEYLKIKLFFSLSDMVTIDLFKNIEYLRYLVFFKTPSMDEATDLIQLEFIHHGGHVFGIFCLFVYLSIWAEDFPIHYDEIFMATVGNI